MEQLITLGETTRSVKTFGIPILTDIQGRLYQFVSEKYKEQLTHDRQFDPEHMRAFDFKLIRGKGKEWQETPRIGDLLFFRSPIVNDRLCSGLVSYIHFGRKRSVGVIYLDEWLWTSFMVQDFTTNN